MYTIYGKPNCPWCDRAKDLLNNLAYEYVDVSLEGGARQILVDMGVRTVPQVFKGTLHIGGFEDLRKYLGAL